MWMKCPAALAAAFAAALSLSLGAGLVAVDLHPPCRGRGASRRSYISLWTGPPTGRRPGNGWGGGATPASPHPPRLRSNRSPSPWPHSMISAAHVRKRGGQAVNARCLRLAAAHFTKEAATGFTIAQSIRDPDPFTHVGVLSMPPAPHKAHAPSPPQGTILPPTNSHILYEPKHI